MTSPTAIALLRDAEAYLSALHVHVARHDQIGADLTCGGCLLRERIAAVLPTLAAEEPADRDALRQRIAELERGLAAAERIRENADFHLGQEMARRQLAEKEAARLSTDRAAVLNAAARRLYTALFPAVYNDLGQKAAEGVNRAVSELRRLADEAQPTTETAPHVVEPRHTCHDQKSAPGHDWECQWCSTLPDGIEAAAGARRMADDTPAATEDGIRTAELLAESATEYRVPVPEGGGTNLIVRRQGVAFGAGWSVAVPGWGGGRAWTAEGWQDSISALTVDRLFCWPDADTAVTEARRALAAGARQDGAQQ